MCTTIINCHQCGAKLQITVTDMGVPGGKDKEYGYCPKCRCLVAEEMTSGFIYVTEMKEDVMKK